MSKKIAKTTAAAATEAQGAQAQQQEAQAAGADAGASDAGQAGEAATAVDAQPAGADTAEASAAAPALVGARAVDLARQIAVVCHEVNYAYCTSIGEPGALPWELSSAETQASVIVGVEKHLANPDLTPADSHANWLAYKAERGWVYGPVKDETKKQHPCMLAYEDLPQAQRTKDYLFRAVVSATAKALGAA